MKFVTTLRKISEEEFKEEEHPRDTGGKFTSKGGGVSRKTKVSKDKKIDNTDRIENVKNDHFISRMLKAGVQPNEMDLQLAELAKKMEEQSNVKTERTFKHDFGDGEGELKLTGTPEYEKALIEHDKLYDEVSKKEEDEYRKSYGWKEGDPFRWTPHNDDPDSAEDGYGSNYTYKHLEEEEIDVMMREYWNDNMDRKEREDRYDYFHSKNIPYLNEDGKTPQELEEEMEEDRSDVSDYFFFTDKKTGKQFRGKGMTKAEIKKRAEHGIGSARILHTDGSVENKIVYDRPLDYDKFHSKTIPAMNFGEKGSKTDKLWDDLKSDEQGRILQDEQKYGNFYSNWQYDQEKLFYSWKSKQGNTGGDNVSEKHNELYSEYSELSKQKLVLDKNDYKIMDKKYPDWRGHGENWIFIEEMMEDKKRDLMRKRGMQTYFQQDPIERQKYVGVLFNGLNAYEKDMLAGNAFDYEAPNNPTEDDELRWEDLSDEEQSDVVREVENDADEDSPIYEIEEIFQKSLPKKDIGFDYDRGIPKPQTTTILNSWANRMENISYEKGVKMEGKDIIIPQYPKSKQRTVKEHEKQVKQLNSKLKEKNQKNMSDKEKWNWQQETLLEDVEEFRDYVRKNEPNLNLDLTFYKMRWNKDDWTQGDPPTTEKEWRKHFIEDSLLVGDKMVNKKVRQLRGLVSLLDQNPKLEEKYQHILDKTDKLNHDNYDLFIKTPEFYRGTSTEELDHYLNHGNTGKMFDWSEKTYPFTALTLDKSSAQSPSEQRIDWEMKDGELSGGKVVITYEGDSVREKAVPVQYNTQSSINWSGTDASERIGFPYNMEAYTEREVRMNQNSEVPKIKEINFGVNVGKYKDKKKLTNKQKFMLIKKYLPLVGGDKSKIKFYKFVEHALESGYEVYAVEEFVEDEHPRDEDGKFTDKDGGGSNKKGLVKSIRDITYDMMIKERQRKLENAMTLKDPDKKLAKVYKEQIEKIEKLRDSNEYRLQGLHGVEFASTKKNTHTKNKDGFKTNKTEIRIGDTVRVGKSPHDGQPHPMVQARMDLIVEAIRNVWNAIPDEYRDGIHILQIHNVRGLSGTTLGKFSSNRKGTVKTLTMRIQQSDSKHIDTLIHTLLHEIAHSIWHNKFQYDEEKVNKFRDGINKLIKESGAITDYVQNDHVDLERLNEIFWDHRGGVGDKHAYASAFLDSEDMSGEEATRYVAYQKKQIETIVANETHSEAFGFLLGGIDKWGPSKKLRENPEMVQEYFKLVKELHDD